MGFQERYNAIVHGVSKNIDPDVLEIKPSGPLPIQQRLPVYGDKCAEGRKKFISEYIDNAIKGGVFKKVAEKINKLAFNDLIGLQRRNNQPQAITHNELRALGEINNKSGNRPANSRIDIVFLSLREMSLEYFRLGIEERLDIKIKSDEPKNRDIQMVGWIAQKFGFQGFESAERIRKELQKVNINTSNLSYVESAWTLFRNKLDAVCTDTGERPVAVLILDTDITSTGLDLRNKKHAVLKRMQNNLVGLANDGQLGLLKRDYNY